MVHQVVQISYLGQLHRSPIKFHKFSLSKQILTRILKDLNGTSGLLKLIWCRISLKRDMNWSTSKSSDQNGQHYLCIHRSCQLSRLWKWLSHSALWCLARSCIDKRPRLSTLCHSNWQLSMSQYACLRTSLCLRIKEGHLQSKFEELSSKLLKNLFEFLSTLTASSLFICCSLWFWVKFSYFISSRSMSSYQFPILHFTLYF